jgi:electron transfer flavoprotein alpha subunit
MILAYIETREDKVKKCSLEVLSEAGRRGGDLGQDVAAVVLGPKGNAVAAELFSYGAAKVYIVENPGLGSYSTDVYAQAIAALARELHPAVILFSADSLGKDLAPRLAAKLGASLASDCTALAVKDGRLEFTRPIYAAKAFMTFTLKTSPQIATLRPNVFPLTNPAVQQGEVVSKSLELEAGQAKARVVEVLHEQGGEIDVSEADIVISGGRGLKGPENFALLRELSALIPRSAVGASRSAVDSGWIGHQHQVGQTGKTVSPSLYMAFGISGAIQHLAGMSGSKVIVAVNKDSEAPIFKYADFGVVGDLFQVIPFLKDELKKAMAE